MTPPCGFPMWDGADPPVCLRPAGDGHTEHHGRNPRLSWTYTACWKPLPDRETWRCLRPTGHPDGCGDQPRAAVTDEELSAACAAYVDAGGWVHGHPAEAMRAALAAAFRVHDR